MSLMYIGILYLDARDRLFEAMMEIKIHNMIMHNIKMYLRPVLLPLVKTTVWPINVLYDEAFTNLSVHTLFQLSIDKVMSGILLYAA